MIAILASLLFGLLLTFVAYAETDYGVYTPLVNVSDYGAEEFYGHPADGLDSYPGNEGWGLFT